MIKFYCRPSPNPAKVALFLEESGLPYELVSVDTRSIAQIGVLTGFSSQPNVLPLQFKNARVNGICVGSVDQFRRLNQFMAEHQIDPVVDQEFRLEDASDAYQKMQDAGHFGKLVIRL